MSNIDLLLATDIEPTDDVCVLIAHNRLSLPDVIEPTTFNSFMKLYHEIRDDDTSLIYLYVTGNGGDADTALAIIDVIQLDGNFCGILMGEARSAHSFIWAACQDRYVSKNGSLGLHGVLVTGDGSSMSQNDLSLLEDKMRMMNDRIVELYTKASNQEEHFWRHIMKRSESASLNTIDSATIKNIEMAQPLLLEHLG